MEQNDFRIRRKSKTIGASHSAVWYAALGLVSCFALACSNQEEPTNPDTALALVIRGTVVAADGQPAAGATVHSQGFRSDCTTQIHVERDTMLVADATGAFKGFLYAEPGVRAACLQVWAQQDEGAVTTQTLQVEFRPANPSGKNLDTASVNLTLP